MQCREGGAHRCGEREWHRRGREGRGTGGGEKGGALERLLAASRRSAFAGMGVEGEGRGEGGEAGGGK